MAQTNTRKLDSGDHFPELELSLVDGSSLVFPSQNNGTWRVFLLYRGHW